MSDIKTNIFHVKTKDNYTHYPTIFYWRKQHKRSDARSFHGKRREKSRSPL